MTIGRLLTTQVTVLRPGTATDEYNNSRPDWTAPTTATWPGRLEQRTAREVTADQATQVADWVLFLAPEAEIASSDRVQVDGTVFEVVGPPALATSPWRASHLEVNLRHVQG
jgi:hypothetical protein